jgi:cold shock CspA family protein
MAMDNGFRIAFRGTDANKPAEAEVRAWLDKLAPLTAAAGVTGGQIVIEGLAQSHHGGRYRAHMELTIPGGAVVVGPDHEGNAAHEDVYVAIRNAFRGLRRRLVAIVGEVAPPAPPPPERRKEWAGGRVTFVDPVLRFGWLANGEGREIYFHGDCVSGGIERLQLGVEVHFQEESGDEGPCATSVKPRPTPADSSPS